MDLGSFIQGILLMFALGLTGVAIMLRAYRRWYDRNCECSCGKCACHRPMEECD